MATANGIPAPRVRSHHEHLGDLGSVAEDSPASPSDLRAGLNLRPGKDGKLPEAVPVKDGSPAPVSLSGDSGAWPGQMTGAAAYMSPMTFVCIFVWYVTGALTNSTSKQSLQQFRNPPFLSLTLMQHLTASLCGTFCLRVLKLRRYKSLPPEAYTWGFARMVLVYAFGFCLTNGSFGAVNASFVDTVKAGEPIATMLLTVCFLRAESPSLPVALSLLPIVAGVSISSMAEASFNLRGFAMAMGSNVCFSARSICAKLLRASLGRSMDNANLFVHVNLCGAALLLPIVLLVEGPVLPAILMRADYAAWLFVANGMFYFINNQARARTHPPARRPRLQSAAATHPMRESI